MLSEMHLYRRHIPHCRYRKSGRRENHRCSCPIWFDGTLQGQRYNKTTNTADWSSAASKLQRLERGEDLPEKSIAAALEEWKNQLRVEESTKRKYLRAVGQLCAFLQSRKIMNLSQVHVEDLERFRASLMISAGTLTRDIQVWRLWLGWCIDHQWLKDNPAKRIKVSGKIKPKQIQPYTTAEVGRIIAACDRIGRRPYERLRARALVMVLNYTGLRISDALMLSRDR